MRRVLLCLLVMLGGMSNQGMAGEMRDIVLHDGSLITAEIVSRHHGIYTVRSDSLGTITIQASKVRTIRPHAAAAPSQGLNEATPHDVAARINGLQAAMSNDPAILALLTSLLEHPEAQAVLSDPAIMQAVRTHDFQTLLAHPAFIRLLNHPVIQDISRRLSQ